mmetsp:Transcript_17617/g.22899  ORF Transcript_17617/g.22899 Transcript_17617/m.22899 type:complete len:547 (+) Transcript_17617:59-1699(+)
MQRKGNKQGLISTNMGDKPSHSTRSTYNWMGWAGLATFFMTVWLMYPEIPEPPEKLSAITWNMAAINNNPFEYWITHDDKAYNKLMEDVSEFINNPGNKDVPINQVFTDSMFNDLCDVMTSSGWPGVEEVRSRWNNEYKNRKIIIEFIKDGLIGKKRLASMPDRYTNTINLADGTSAMRPTVINCYQGDLSSTDKWWRAWRHFMFEEEVTVKGKGGVVETKPIRNMLSKIKQSKYPAISAEEEAISIPLQAMAGAVFDAILIHMMNTLAPNNWQDLREDMCEKLNRKKNDRTVDILETTYASVDIQFLQEVAGAFIEKAHKRSIADIFDIWFPEDLDSDRDQNSLILLKKNLFQNVHEKTREVESVGQSKGDLFVITADHVDGTQYLLASFHGDTNGLLTIPVLTAVHEYAKKSHPTRRLVFGMDANTYDIPDPGNKQDVVGFAKFYNDQGLNSCYGHEPNPKNFTTFHARTYLQPQLNKAIKYSEKDIKGDRNPKDFIIFKNHEFKSLNTMKDNTGHKEYIEGMVFPTLTFPSDHGITATSLSSI